MIYLQKIQFHPLFMNTSYKTSRNTSNWHCFKPFMNEINILEKTSLFLSLFTTSTKFDIIRQEQGKNKKASKKVVCYEIHLIKE